jgi:hypothetical protein
LTCKACNSRAGSGVDAQMGYRKRFLEFVRGSPQGPPIQPTEQRPATWRLRGTLELAGRTLIGGVKREGEAILVDASEHRNNPAVHAAWFAEFEQMTKQADRAHGWLRLTVSQSYDRHEALVGWLRAAYLVAFAAYGYSYALHVFLEPVRDQLAQPKTAVLPVFHLIVPDALATDRGILYVERPGPEPWYSLAVQMGQHLVFLPLLDGQGDLFDRLASDQAKGPELHVIGRELVPWPHRPMHRLDGTRP